MGLLSNEVKEKAKEVLGDMEKEVTVYLFLDEDCESCEENEKLTNEISDLSDKINVEKKAMDSELAKKYNAGKYEGAPVSVITDGEIEGVKFFGTPSGQEFKTYLDDIVSVSKGKTDLDKEVKQEVKEIEQEVNIKVFVTPKCPYCPRAVRVAHKFAIENEKITSEMIEAQEFMDLAREFEVGSVPQVNINEKEGEFTGAYPPEKFLKGIQEALK